MPKSSKAKIGIATTKVTMPKFAKILAAKKLKQPKVNISQYLGPKTTAMSKAEQRLKVSAGKKIKIMKSAIKAYKPKKK